MFGGLLVFMTGYALYAFFFGGIDGLPVLPQAYLPAERKMEPFEPGPHQEGAAEIKMKQAFGNESLEAKRKIKLYLGSKGLLLAAKTFDIEDGRVKLKDFSAALFGKDAGPGSDPEINTIQCDVAYLTLDKEVTSIADLSNGKITRVELRGETSGVRITNNRRTFSKSDDIDVFITGAPLFYDATTNKIWTTTDGVVQLLDLKAEPQPTRITAYGMEIMLSEGTGPNRPKSVSKAKKNEDALSNVEMVRLLSHVEMHLYLDASSGFLAGPKDAALTQGTGNKGEAAEKSQVTVKTNGSFYYDPRKDLASFSSPPAGTGGREPVRVTREHKAGDIKRYDELLCDHLELQFRKKPEAEPNPSRDPRSPDKEIDSALATGKVELTLETENLQAWGEELHYRSATATTGPQTILKGPNMHAVRDGHKIAAQDLHLIGADKSGAGQRAFARGPGRIDLFDKSNPNNLYPSCAEWHDNLTIVQEYEGASTLDVITMTGDAKFEDNEHKQSLSGQRLRVWLESQRGGERAIVGRPANATSASTQRVRKIEAFEKVALKATAFIRQTDHLTIFVQNEPAPGTRLPDVPVALTQPLATTTARPATSDSQTPVAQPRLAAPVPEPAGFVQTPTKSRKPLEVWANDVTIHIATVADKHELSELLAEGAVHVYQEGEETDNNGKANGVDIQGEMLKLIHRPRGDNLFVFGDSRDKLAKLKLGELFIMGPRVNIDQELNIAVVEGAGVMNLPGRPFLDNTKPNGGASVAPPKTPGGKSQLSIHWSRRMEFDGKYAEFRGGVQAYQDSGLLRCEELVVSLNRLVSFKEGQKENQDVQVEKFVCDRQVWVVDEKKDAGGKRLTFTRLVAVELAMNDKDGPLIATGPAGKFEHLAPASADMFAPPDARPKDKGAKEVMKLTRIFYDGRMFSKSRDNSRESIFFDNVQVFHFPTEDENATMDPDKPGKDGFYLKCARLKVLTWQQNDKTSQEMRAEENVFFRTQDFFGTAAVMKYLESQEQIILEGVKGSPAALYRKLPGMTNTQTFKGAKIIYNRKTGEVIADGVTVITAWREVDRLNYARLVINLPYTAGREWRE
jgi:hypothetical protein